MTEILILCVNIIYNRKNKEKIPDSVFFERPYFYREILIMEVFDNYVEFMFKDLPQNERILTAKQELLQKMAQKFENHKKSGKTESEAVSLVISEYNDLQKVAVDLGIVDLLPSAQSEPSQTKTEGKESVYYDGPFTSNSSSENEEKRKISVEIAEQFINARKKIGIMRSVGIACFILCLCGPILFSTVIGNDVAGVFTMFLLIAAGVLLCIFSNYQLEDLSFLKTENCTLEEETQKYLKEQKHNNLKYYQFLVAAGVLLCTASIFPPMIMTKHSEISAALLFVFVAAGVFLIVFASTIQNSYKILLNIESNYVPEQKPCNKKIEKINSVYWQTVCCIYLVFSFITHRWDVSWLIWPVGAVVYALLKVVFTGDDD